MVKGSVAVDGVSLTVNRCGPDFFEVSIIPHTASLTTVGLKKAGDSVNLEADMIGKYVEKFLTQKQMDKEQTPGVDLQLLARAGYL
jgi:riboflavin synthase